MEEEVGVVELVDGLDREIPAAALNFFALHLALGARHHRGGLGLSLADELQRSGFALGQEADPLSHSRQVFNREPGDLRAVDFHDAVSGLNPGASGRAFWIGFRHHDAFILGKVDVPVEVLQGLQLEARPAPVHLAVFPDLIRNHSGHLDGHSESEIAPAAHHPSSIESDHLAERVDQRAAGVAWVDRCVGLEPRAVFTRPG